MVSSVEGTALTNAQGLSYVKAHARIASVPDRVKLQSGMSGQAAIEIERRTMLSWVLWPLLKNFKN